MINGVFFYFFVQITVGNKGLVGIMHILVFGQRRTKIYLHVINYFFRKLWGKYTLIHAFFSLLVKCEFVSFFSL